jgi:hypothetical protein
MTPETEEALVQGLGEIKATLKAQSDTLAKHGDTLEDLSHAINGNGQPGLKVMVFQHDTTLGNMKKVLWIVASPVLAALGGGLVAASVYLIHIIH